MVRRCWQPTPKAEAVRPHLGREATSMGIDIDKEGEQMHSATTCSSSAQLHTHVCMH